MGGRLNAQGPTLINNGTGAGLRPGENVGGLDVQGRVPAVGNGWLGWVLVIREAN